MTDDHTAIRAEALATIDRWADRLVAASHELHARPELAYEEHHAHEVLTGLLQAAGLAVEPEAYGMPTAFAARAGVHGPTIAVLCEYDALPGIGHACGHNIIGTAGAGAAIGAAAVAEACGGRVVALGSPAEEGGAGKVRLIDAGAFDEVAAALMVHPAGADLTRMHAIAIHEADVHYTGVAAHAAAAPHKGRNALDAAVLGYVNIAALRQHIRPDERVHGIFTDSGAAANVVPAHARATWYVRSPTTAGLERLKARVVACLEAGAAAAGCEVEIHWPNPAYADMADNAALLERYVANAATLGREVTEPDLARVVGSTDMGNVSHVVPSIHPMIQAAPGNVAIHTADFARYAGGEQGDRAVVDGAKAMALTVVDLWLDPELLTRVRETHGRR